MQNLNTCFLLNPSQSFFPNSFYIPSIPSSILSRKTSFLKQTFRKFEYARKNNSTQTIMEKHIGAKTVLRGCLIKISSASVLPIQLLAQRTPPSTRRSVNFGDIRALPGALGCQQRPGALFALRWRAPLSAPWR
ncbi:hypothetical protein CEXT_807851 [Caerostris extrusa]|uniref:Uncharacterized protein n=1 Tax=Caerostris extrusa TaxID=172846 RepID=A0AAV4MM94_CAEEX|nr:hypothetical protein CEXT_807851 [Caerostris extrusa]